LGGASRAGPAHPARLDRCVRHAVGAASAQPGPVCQPVEADGTQLSTDVSSLSALDQTQIPKGKHAASIVALDLTKDELALSVAGQMAANGNVTQANMDINVAASSIGQTTADIKKCN